MSKRARVTTVTLVVFAPLASGPTINTCLAVKVTHDTLSVLFEDDIEDLAGTVMTAEIGVWTTNSGAPVTNTLITGPVGPPGPLGAANGTTYVERRRSGGLGDLYANGRFGCVNDRVCLYMEAGTTSQWQSMVVLDDNINNVNGTPFGGNTHAYILRKGTDTFFSDDAAGGGSIGADIPPDQWNLMTVIADLDANTNEVLINNVSSGVYNSNNDLPVGRIWWRAETGEDDPGHWLDGLATTPAPSPTSFEWSGSTPGDWNVVTNWTPSGFVDGANFAALGGGGTVVTDQAVTVNSITFDGSNSYNLTGVGQVNLAVGTAGPPLDPRITVNQGNHQFQVNVQLDGSTSVDVGIDSSMAFNNRLDLNGNTLTKTGQGTLSINNNLISGGSGTIDCQTGTCSGTGTISGDLVNGALVAPGNISQIPGNLRAATVPEPSAVILLFLGIGSAVGLCRTGTPGASSVPLSNAGRAGVPVLQGFHSNQ